MRWVQVPVDLLAAIPAPWARRARSTSRCEPGEARLFPLPMVAGHRRCVLVSSLSDAVAVPQDEPVVVVRARLAATGRELDLYARAGVHTAEWACDRPDVRARARPPPRRPSRRAGRGRAAASRPIATKACSPLPGRYYLDGVSVERLPARGRCRLAHLAVVDERHAADDAGGPRRRLRERHPPSRRARGDPRRAPVRGRRRGARARVVAAAARPAPTTRRWSRRAGRGHAPRRRSPAGGAGHRGATRRGSPLPGGRARGPGGGGARGRRPASTSAREGPGLLVVAAALGPRAGGGGRRARRSAPARQPRADGRRPRRRDPSRRPALPRAGPRPSAWPWPRSARLGARIRASRGATAAS